MGKWEDITKQPILTASTNDYTIYVRGYPLRVFCEWAQNSGSTKTYLNLPATPSTFSHWGGSSLAGAPTADPTNRTFDKARLLVDRCFLAIQTSDVAYSVVSGESVSDEFGKTCESHTK